MPGPPRPGSARPEAARWQLPATTAVGAVDLGLALTAWLGAWLGGMALGAVVVSASGHAGDDVTPLWVSVAGTVCLWIPMLAVLVALSRRFGSGSVRADLGLSWQPVDALGVPIGILSQLVVVRAVYLPLEQWWPGTFDREVVERPARDLADSASSGWLVALLVLLVVAGAPLFEELVYRGLLQGAALRRLSEPVAVVVVAALFALIHFRWVQFPGLFVFALVLGACALRTGRLGMSTTAHMAFNATGLVLVAGR